MGQGIKCPLTPRRFLILHHFSFLLTDYPLYINSSKAFYRWGERRHQVLLYLVQPSLLQPLPYFHLRPVGISQERAATRSSFHQRQTKIQIPFQTPTPSFCQSAQPETTFFFYKTMPSSCKCPQSATNTLQKGGQMCSCEALWVDEPQGGDHRG